MAETMTTAPQLVIGQRIAGATVIAAIALDARPGYLPGLHIVTAEDGRQFATWEAAYQPGTGWAVFAGTYFPHDGTPEGRAESRRLALRDMIGRYGA